MWTNAGVAPHTVSAKDGSFGSEMLAAGASFEQTFTTPGSYAYLCQVHPEMTGTVVVTEAETSGCSTGGAGSDRRGGDPGARHIHDWRPAPLSPTRARSPESSSPSPLISIASALFARLLGGLSKRVEGP